jgi:hypothetical protein
MASQLQRYEFTDPARMPCSISSNPDRDIIGIDRLQLVRPE